MCVYADLKILLILNLLSEKGRTKIEMYSGSILEYEEDQDLSRDS